MTLLRALRLALSVALIALASGVPNVVLAALDGDECAAPCGGDLDGKRCPPNCTQGSCAKTVVSVSARVRGLEAPIVSRTESAPAGVEAPVLPLFTRGVFHPPRA